MVKRYSRDVLQQLREGTLPFNRVHQMLSDHKDPGRFRDMLEIAQDSVPWDDKVLLPLTEHLYVVEKDDGTRIVKCRCGYEYCHPDSNWKLEALVYVRDSEESFQELYPAVMSGHPDWMTLREFICPNCATLLEVEAVPPGYPVVFDFQPDLDGFYERWLPAAEEG